VSAHLVSAIIPTHNRVDRTLQAAASVLDQEGHEVELIVVDDASSDDTPDQLAALAERDGRVRVLRNDQSLGPCGARNRGIAVARGDLIATCDDDDVWLPGTVATMVGFLEASPDVGAATCWHQVAHGTRLVDFRGPTHYGPHVLLWQNVAAIPFLMVRREAFAADPWYDPALAGGEDWELCLRCALERPLRTVPHVLYRYRQHGGPRVTSLPERHRQVRAALLAKHGSIMSPGCIAYHHTVMDLLVGERRQAAGHLPRAAARDPLGAARGALLLAGGSAASRWGVRHHDPGRGARFAARVVPG
jgi:glycosyltransferase involved in cell wall biosynthesis